MKRMLKGYMTSGEADVNFYNNENDIICYKIDVALDLDIAIQNPERAFIKWLKEEIKQCFKNRKRVIKNNSYIFIKEFSGFVELKEDMSKNIESELSFIHHAVYYSGFSGKARVKRKHNKIYLDGWQFDFSDVYYISEKSYKTYRDWKKLGIEKYTDDELKLKVLAERNFKTFCKTGEVIPVK